MEEKNGYWQRYWRRRLTRRTLLRGTALGAAGLTAAAIVGCGDDEEGVASPTATPAATTPSATTPSATATPVIKRGGLLRIANRSPIASFDPNRSTGGGSLNTLDLIYSRLFKMASGPGTPVWTSKTEGDLVKSSDISPDGLVYTFKLRDNVMFHPPVSRLMTADDVIFSWRRFKGEIPGTEPAAEVQRLAFVKSVEKVDGLTVRFTLDEPIGTLFAQLVNPHSLAIFPQEIGTAFDSATEAAGSGPFMLEKHDIGSVVTVRRNPDWHFGPDKPYLDGIEQFIIPEYATQFTQFLGGNLDRLTAVRPTDLKRVMDTVEDVVLDIYSGGSVHVVAFSGNEPAAPWTNPLVRQALSMAIDRETMAEAAYDYTGLKALGIDVEPVINNFFPSGYTDYWLNPRGTVIKPENARLFSFDQEGAKNLLAQAGYGDGFSAKFHYVTTFPSEYTKMAELMVQYWGQIGINFTLSAIDYSADYAPKIRKGDFEGLAYIIAGGSPDPVDLVSFMYAKDGPRNPSRVDDLAIQAAIKKIQLNPSEAERIQGSLDLQNGLLPENMYYIPTPGGSGPVINANQAYMRNVIEYHTVGGSGVYTNSVNFPNFWRADV